MKKPLGIIKVPKKIVDFSIFSEIIKNEEKFPYLVKEYDSTNQDFEYKVKIFKIDYDEYDSIK